MFTTTAKVSWIGYLVIKGLVHVSSVFFAVSAAWQGDWFEAAMFATFAFMTV